MTSLLVALWLAGSARAGSLYVNGIQADGLRNFDFTDVNVHVDDQGNIWIDAPHYKVEVEGPGQAQLSGPAPGAASTARVPQTANGVALGTWWLVTEDDGSTGQQVEVRVNGSLVYVVRSGQKQVILDIGPYLHKGANRITFTALPGTPGGGALAVYVGQGRNEAGVVYVEQPLITYVRRSTDSPTGGSRFFTINVN